MDSKFEELGRDTACVRVDADKPLVKVDRPFTEEGDGVTTSEALREPLTRVLVERMVIVKNYRLRRRLGSWVWVVAGMWKEWNFIECTRTKHDYRRKINETDEFPLGRSRSARRSVRGDHRKALSFQKIRPTLNDWQSRLAWLVD